MDTIEKPSILVQFATILVSISMSLGALFWFVLTAIDTVQQLLLSLPGISFNKGSFYLLGVAIGLGALVTFMIIEVWNKKPPSDRVTQLVTRVAISGVVIMFLLPHLVHYPIAHYLENQGYEVCHEASHRWLHSQEIVYVNNINTCLALADKQLLQDR